MTTNVAKQFETKKHIEIELHNRIGIAFSQMFQESGDRFESADR
jgi:hypothetical protein